MFSQYNPRAKLAILCNTGNVPNDGKYYITREGETIFSFITKKLALGKYQELIDELNLPSLLNENDTKITYGNMMEDYFTRTSNNKLLGTSFGKDQKAKARFNKSR